jgi:MIP family channel proteins
MRPYVAEFLGTFTLVLIGVGAVTSGQGLVVGALSHGLAVVGLAYTYGHISGAHLNPAVSFAFFIARKISLATLVGYWVTQSLGAILASLLLALFLGGDTVAAGQTVGTLTRDAVWTAALFEAVQVFVLVMAIFQAAVYGKAGNLAPVAIGFTLAALILMGGIYTGASINPARTLGPAVVAGDYSYLLPYLIGLFGGAALAGMISGYVMQPDKETAN